MNPAALTRSSSYTCDMNVATSPESVGVRDLKNNLSRFLKRVGEGEEFVVTDHGKPVARLVAIDPGTNRLAELIAAGLVTPAVTPQRPLPRPIKTAGTVSDLVAEQRR